jgi:ATP-dependent protease HslVU (ClpYQ) peptidase subunit
MTVIAAVRTDEGVWMCSDSRVTSNSAIIGQIPKIITYQVLPHRAADPVVEVLIAVAGRAALASIAEHSLEIPTTPDSDDDAEWNGWAYRIACLLAKLAVDATPSLLHDGLLDYQALLACGTRLWALEDQHVMACEQSYAIGSGAMAARGALLIDRFHRLRDPASAVAAAVQAAIDLDAACGGEIHLQRTTVGALTSSDGGGEPLPTPI